MKKVILPSYKPGFDRRLSSFDFDGYSLVSFRFSTKESDYSTLFYFYPNEMHGKLALIASKVLNVFSLLQQRG